MKQEKQVSKKKYDLIFKFELIDAIQIQQMLMAINQGYKIVEVASSHNVVEFKLLKDFQND